ncbi:PIN domain-containing protein [Streptomyces xinghaiensis]|uniref:PIN domain-containing protein n=1 Tax=Streptomyces xinghaiensis TaxID=1038928 RepID=UPI003412BEFC
MILVADTSGLICSYDLDDPDSDRASAVLDRAALVVASPIVFAEIEHVLTRNAGRVAANAVLDSLLAAERSLRLAIPEITSDMLRAARAVQTRYADLALDLADGVNTVLAAEYQTDAILTLDRRDFRAIRPLTAHKAFRVLPDDH